MAVEAAPDGAVAGFTVTATASGDGPQRADDACQTLTLDQSGLRGATDSGGGEGPDITARCWR